MMFGTEESLACYQRVLELVRPDDRADCLASLPLPSELGGL